MNKKIKALANYLDERIATMKKNSESLTDEKAKAAAKESLSQLETLRKQLNDLGEDDPDSLEQLRKDVTDALERIDRRMNEFAEQIRALQERDGAGEEPAANKMSKKAANYLGSEEAMHDFLQSMRESKNADMFARKWRGKLSENGITIAEGSEDAYMPEAVRGAIQDAWEKPGNWLNRLNNTGAKAFNVRVNTSEQGAETSRAKGHREGATKVNQALSFAAKKIVTQMIYKKIDLDNQTIFEDDGSLLNYIVTELVNQWLVEIERAILVGDGRLDNDPNKIGSIEAVVDADSMFATGFTHDAAQMLNDEMRQMCDAINNDDGGRIVVFMPKATLTEMSRFVFGENSSSQYLRREDMAAQIGADEIITTSLLGSDYLAVAMRLEKYVTVGRINPAFTEWENYDTNVRNYRVENPFGGALEGVKSAAYLAAE